MIGIIAVVVIVAVFVIILGLICEFPNTSLKIDLRKLLQG